MKNIAGEQTLLTSNIFHTNLCNFSKIQTPIKIHSLMPGASNLAILLISTRSFHFCHSFVSQPIFMIDKVTWPCHAKSLLVTARTIYTIAAFLPEAIEYVGNFGPVVLWHGHFTTWRFFFCLGKSVGNFSGFLTFASRCRFIQVINMTFISWFTHLSTLALYQWAREKSLRCEHDLFVF